MPGVVTSVPPSSPSGQLVWKDAGAPTEFLVCMVAIALCIAWMLVNAKAPSIKLKRRRKDWEDE